MKFETTPRRGVLILALLLAVNIVNYIDRQLPYILVDAIRDELGLSDAQFGLMAGTSYSLAFSVCALFLARMADRFSARAVLSASLVVWSLMTTVGGFAQSFQHLVMARIGVGAGESGAMPAAHALIARIYPAQNHAIVYAVFSLAVPIGSTLGLMLGGWINDSMGWRQAFFVIGLPGVLLALLAWRVLPELQAGLPANPSQPSFTQVVRHMFGIRSYAHTTAACVVFGIAYFALTVFGPAFLMRVHGQSAGQAGLALGIASGLGGAAGILGGGILADRLGRKDPRWRQFVPAIGVALCAPAALWAWLVPDVQTALVMLALVHLLGMICLAPTWANVQLLAPDDMRATAAALVQFCILLVGASLGPFAVGWLSDQLTPQFGAAGLRYALCGIAIFLAWAALHYYLAGRAMGRDLSQREQLSPARAAA
ncbi:spinster family MFS transporter [Variovorax saccharolyticus]|uniref:spinster family MFS transporter n=1 Tax=Variovorax saccharolyticus TaxID=3053516 RepID=UPI002575FA57|nr:MFS transporter [Variovorax sp. J31P216]MDM0030112.1 MFS transporter [Variovorax sp. J31P216]